MSTADEGDDQGYCGYLYLRLYLIGGGLVGHVVWVGNVGYDPRIGRMLGGFHDRVAHRLMGRQP